jgi:PKD repeat protein
VDVTFSSVALTAGTKYWIVLHSSEATSGSGYTWQYTNGGYTGGVLADNDPGPGWTTYGDGYDMYFRTYMQTGGAPGPDVTITIDPPPNQAEGQTGVQVERATNSSFTAGTTTIQAFASNYSLTDTPGTAGTYYYRIKYKNQLGVETNYSVPVKDVTVTGSGTPPVAAFTGVPLSGEAPLSVTFTDGSTGDVTSWSWNFGAGATPATASTEGPHSVSYSTAGKKTVTLTVTGPGGSDDLTRTEYILVLAAGTVIYVSDATGSDSNNGTTWELAKKTIQAGIDAASAGYTVMVGDGTYTGSGNYNLNFGGKDIAVRSLNGAEKCIIDCNSLGRGFSFETAVTSAAVVSGFTITSGIQSYQGGGI